MLFGHSKSKKGTNNEANLPPLPIAFDICLALWRAFGNCTSSAASVLPALLATAMVKKKVAWKR